MSAFAAFSPLHQHIQLYKFQGVNHNYVNVYSVVNFVVRGLENVVAWCVYVHDTQVHRYTHAGSICEGNEEVET